MNCASYHEEAKEKSDCLVNKGASTNEQSSTYRQREINGLWSKSAFAGQEQLVLNLLALRVQLNQFKYIQYFQITGFFKFKMNEFTREIMTVFHADHQSNIAFTCVFTACLRKFQFTCFVFWVLLSYFSKIIFFLYFFPFESYFHSNLYFSYLRDTCSRFLLKIFLLFSPTWKLDFFR